MSDIILIDVEDGLKRVMNKGKLYASLLEKFKSDQNLGELESALACGDMEKAGNVAHTLKGLTANLSLVELHKQSLEIESQIKANNVNPDQLNNLKNVYSLTLEELEKVINQYAE